MLRAIPSTYNILKKKSYLVTTAKAMCHHHDPRDHHFHHHVNVSFLFSCPQEKIPDSWIWKAWSWQYVPTYSVLNPETEQNSSVTLNMSKWVRQRAKSIAVAAICWYWGLLAPWSQLCTSLPSSVITLVAGCWTFAGTSMLWSQAGMSLNPHAIKWDLKKDFPPICHRNDSSLLDCYKE